MAPKTLTAEDVCFIHEVIVSDFAESGDPVVPAGVRSVALLESAVGRQHSGFGPFLKYRSPVENAATLAFGLCNDHPFHNGNKRTALVAMLAHLDRNKLMLVGANKRELYRLMLAVASKQVASTLVPSKRYSVDRTDREVEALAAWLDGKTQRVRRGYKVVTYRELRHILGSFGYTLSAPKHGYINISKQVTRRKPPLFKREEVHKSIGNIPYRGDREPVSVDLVKYVRGVCNLREEDGVDTEAFYRSGAVVDTFVNQYRTVLRRLGKT